MNNKMEIKKLKDLAVVISGVNIPTKFRLKKSKWQLIRGRNIIEDRVVDSDVYIPEEFAHKSIKATVVPGDILLSVIFEQYKVGIVPSFFPPAIADRSIVIIRPRGINKKYLHKFLTSKTGKSALIGQLASIARGEEIKFVTTKNVSELNIPLLPKCLLDISQEISPNTSKISEIKKSYEREIVDNIRLLLLAKGWKEENILLEYTISQSLHADIVIKSKGIPQILFEVKKKTGNYLNIKNQIINMSRIAGIKESYLISAEGIKKITNKGKIVSVIDLPSPLKGKNG